MHDRNPYAPSPATLALPGDASVGTHDGANVWREGDVLILVPDSDLPDRCVKCNAPAETPIKKRRVYWHHPAIYLVIVLNVILYVIVALIARRKATVRAGLCGQHKKRRRVSILLGWIGAIAGFATIVGGSGNSGYLMLFGTVMLLGSIIAGLIFARVVYAKRIDKSFVRLKGCGTAFLDSLPPFPG